MNKRFLRLVSIVLALVILLQTTSVLEVVAFAASEIKEETMDTVSETEIMGEDISKREESVKHFKMSDGTFLAVSYSQPVHYKDENGSWQEIDNTLKDAIQQMHVPMAAMDANATVIASADNTVDLTSNAYVNTSNKFQVSLPETLNTQSWVGTFHLGHSLYFRFENIGQSEAVVNIPEEQELDTFAQATTVHTGSSVAYENVLPGVDILYQLNGQQLKENILFKSLANTPASMSFVLWADDLVLSELEDGSYIFTADDNTCFVLPAPYMVDYDGESSGTVEVSVEEIAEDTYRFTYVPDRQWLESTDRAWPVVLDPVTCATSTPQTIEDTYTRSGYPTYNYYLDSYVYTGYYSAATKNVRAFVQHNATPVLSSGDVVVKAQLYMTGRIYKSSGEMQVNAYAVTEEWASKSTCWNTQPNAETEALDFQIVDSTTFKTYIWDVTSAVQRWYSGDLAGKGDLGKFGFMLKAPNDEDSGTIHISQFLASDTSNSAKPQLAIYYRNTTGIEPYWDYTSASAGRAGTVAVNNYTGNLVVSRTDMAYDGNIMPASMTFTYNTNDYSNNIGYGAGWRINYAQTIELVTIGENDYYRWIDGDGTAIYFYNNEGTWKDENGLSYTLAVTEDGYTITDRDNNQLKFDAEGRLKTVVDGKIGTNTIQIDYISDKKIRTVTDGAGRQYRFSYNENNGGNLSSISYMGHIKPDNESVIETVSYSYTNGQLVGVTYEDKKVISYDYENGYLKTATGCQNDCIEISYGSGSPARVMDVTAKDTATDTVVSKASFLYGDNYTKVIDARTNRWCIYQFNNLGNTVSVYNQRGQALYGSYSDTTPNQLVNSSRLQDTVTNLLNTRSYANSWSTTATVQAGETYTLSGEGTGTLTLTAGTVTQTSDIVSDGRTEVTITIPDGITTLTALGSSPFSDLQLEKTEASSRYNMLIDTDMAAGTNWVGTNTSTVDGRSTAETGARAYLDNYSIRIGGESTKAKQYTQTISVTGVGGDNYSFGAWVKAASVALDNRNSQNASDPTRRFGVQVRLMNGDTVVAEKYIAGNEACGEWQFISGSVQANAAYTTVEYSLVYDYNANEAYFDGAQLFKEKFAYVYTYDENGRISEVTDLEGNVITYTYRGDSSDIETIKYPGENEADRPVYTYSYDADTNLLSGMTTATGIETLVKHDAYGNVTETRIISAQSTNTEVPETQSNESEEAAAPTEMLSSQGYTDNHNFPKTVTGTDRNTMTYTYDLDNSTLTSVTDAKGVVTSNIYDEMRRPKKTSIGDAVVSYDYDVDRLASTHHTGGANGTTYRFTYTTAGLTDKIYILNIANDEAIPAELPDEAWLLVENDYNANTWTLASQTYGNGGAWYYTYNEFDELVSAYTVGGDTGTELRYFYNSEGALARVEQYDTSLSGSTISGRTLVSTERYYYDTADRATRIIRQDADGDSYECRWEYDHNNNVTNLVEVVNGQTHTTAYTYDLDQRISSLTADGRTTSYTYDGFGRLSSQTIGIGEGTSLLKQYTFLSVQDTVTNENGETEEVNCATSQVGTLTLNTTGYARAYTYTYDANGNILSVSDGVNTTSYTYDTLNQLVREDNQAAGKTWVYSYDNGGNILLKKEYSYTTEAISLTDADEPNYVYGDAHWGDLLTMYNNVEIAHDEIGNPLSDGTWSYTWENGRQLVQMYGENLNQGENDVTISYAYNADGLRTSKTVLVNNYTTHTHSYTVTVVAPTCSMQGYTLHTCEGCGDSYKTTYVSALGHSFENLVCTRCGFKWGDDVELPVDPEPSYPIIVASEEAEETEEFLGMEDVAAVTSTGEYDERTLISTVVTDYDYIYAGTQLIQMTVTTTVDNGTPTSEVLYFTYDAAGTPMTVTYNGNTYYYATNLQGDVIAILDTAGAAVVEYTYDAWGNHLSTRGTNPLSTVNPLRYRGYVYDTESTLYYLQSRYYDPKLGRFINADAYASTGQGVLGNNMFAYCGNNPVMTSDPTGKFFVDWDLLPNKQTGEAFGKWLVALTEKDQELIESGEVSYESRGSDNGAHIKNSHKIKTPWVMSDFIEENRSDDITGSTTGVVYEWVFHNAAYKIGSVFGLDSISEPAAHLDVGKTIFDDQRPPFTLKWLMSEGMKWTYCVLYPENAKHDFLSWILGET